MKIRLERSWLHDTVGFYFVACSIRRVIFYLHVASVSLEFNYDIRRGDRSFFMGIGSN